MAFSPILFWHMPNIIPFARTSEENWVVCILDRTNNLFYFIFLLTVLCLGLRGFTVLRLKRAGLLVWLTSGLTRPLHGVKQQREDWMERIDSSFLVSAFTESEGRRRSTSMVKADSRGKLLPSYIPLFLVRQPA